MAKVLRCRSAKADDPIYTGGVEMFSPISFSRSSKAYPSAPAGEIQEASKIFSPALKKAKNRVPKK